jgi:regulator of sigma D
MDTIYTSERAVYFNETTLHYIPEGFHFQVYDQLVDEIRSYHGGHITLMMGTLRSSLKSVNICQITLFKIPEDSHLQSNGHLQEV